MELQLLLEALFNVRSTRESTRDPGAEKASLAKFYKGCTHQLVFGCEVGVLPAVPPEDVKVSPLTLRTYTLYVFAPAPCACAPVCKNRHTRGSTIGRGGDTTISSPGRSPKQPLPGMRLHDPLHGRQACPEFIAFDQGVGQICPR